MVATLVGSPFRMLQMGAGYTLLPRLRAARLHRRHGGGWFGTRPSRSALIGAVGGIVLLAAAPWIADRLLAGKYELSSGLMIAALVSGVPKLADAIATTMVWALASPRAAGDAQLGELDLRRYRGRAGWLGRAGVCSA